MANPAHRRRRADADHAGSGFSDRRHYSRPLGHPAGLRDGPRLDPRFAAGSRSRNCASEREALIITEIPYQVNKAVMIEKIAELVRDKRIEGISDIRDESDRHGMRVVIELKRDAVPDVVLNQLYRFTPLQTSFGCNFVALNGGRPKLMKSARHPHGLRRFPRGSGHAARPLPAEQGARPRPCPGRPCCRRGQYRRGHRADPRRARSGRRRASS